MVAHESLVDPRPRFPALLLAVLRRPRHAFRALSEGGGGRAWLLMACLTMLLAALPIIASAPIAMQKTQEAFRTQMENPAMGELTPEQLAQAERLAANPLFIVVLPTLAAVIGLWIVWLVWAGGLHLLGTLLGGSSSFGQMWQVVVWSWLPYAVRGLLQTIFILATGSLIEHPGLSGLVAPQQTIDQLVVQPPSTGQLILQSLLGRLDLFLVWNLALLITGVMVTAHLSRRKSIMIVFGIWIALALLGLLPALAGGVFGGAFGAG